jgi:hypothetical protein
MDLSKQPTQVSHVTFDIYRLAWRFSSILLLELLAI